MNNKLPEKQENQQSLKWFPNAFLNQKTGTIDFKWNGVVHSANKDTVLIYLGHKEAVQVYRNSKYVYSIEGIDDNYKEISEDAKAVKGISAIVYIGHKDKSGMEVRILARMDLFGAKGDYLYKLLSKSFICEDEKNEGEIICQYVKIGLDTHTVNTKTSKVVSKTQGGNAYFCAAKYNQFSVHVENSVSWIDNCNIVDNGHMALWLTTDENSEFVTLLEKWNI